MGYVFLDCAMMGPIGTTPSGTLPVVRGLGSLSTRVLVYPCCVTELASRELEHPLKDRVRSKLLFSQLDGDIRCGRSSCSIVARAIAFILGHGSVYQRRERVSENFKGYSISRLTVIDSRIVGVPLHITARVDAVVEVAVREDTAVLSVPRSTKIALVCDFERSICFPNITVVDVDAVLVFERGVGALPSRDTSSAAAKRHGRVCHPASAEAVEEVGLACNFAIVHVCVA